MNDEKEEKVLSQILNAILAFIKICQRYCYLVIWNNNYICIEGKGWLFMFAATKWQMFKDKQKNQKKAREEKIRAEAKVKLQNLQSEWEHWAKNGKDPQEMPKLPKDL